VAKRGVVGGALDGAQRRPRRQLVVVGEDAGRVVLLAATPARAVDHHRMRHLGVGYGPLIEPPYVVGAHLGDGVAVEREVDQRLVLHASGILDLSATGPDRLADDAHAMTGMGVGEGA